MLKLYNSLINNKLYFGTPGAVTICERKLMEVKHEKNTTNTNFDYGDPFRRMRFRNRR